MSNNFEVGWDYVAKGFEELKKILEGLDEKFSAHEEWKLSNYSLAVKGNDCSQLYAKYKETFEDYIDSTVLPSIKAKHGLFMLRELVKRWKNHKVMVRWMSNVCSKLDSSFIPRMKVPSLYEVGMYCFREKVYEVLMAKVRCTVIELIEQEREGKNFDGVLLKDVIDIFDEIGKGQLDCYEIDFEFFMLDASTEYYSTKASKWIVGDTRPYYMIKAEECLKKEMDLSHYLRPSTGQKLVERVKNELLVVYINQLIEEEHYGCRGLLRNDKEDDLSRMYMLLGNNSKGLNLIVKCFREHVIAEGTTLVQQAKDATSNKDQTFIRNIIHLHAKCMVYVKRCFTGHSLFHKALKESFQVFCNTKVGDSSSAELLASFCDYILMKGGIENSSGVACKLDQAMELLEYISDKDHFAEFYRKKLSRRLLFDRGVIGDNEKYIMTKLKQNYGESFTDKMQMMVTDLALVRENDRAFEDYLFCNPDVSPGLDLKVTVIAPGFWPSYKTCDLYLPTEMVKCVDIFKKFYQNIEQRRKLTWIHSLGSCEVSGNFDSGLIMMTVGTYQAMVLMLFNSSEKLSYKQIQTQLNMNDEELVRVLLSLSSWNYKLLNKMPPSKTISPDDQFEFNSKFTTNKKRKINITLPPIDERMVVVENDRRYAIEASLVRIMKTHEVLDYQELIIKCVNQLSHIFKPNPEAIKQYFEGLISNKFLERD